MLLKFGYILSICTLCNCGDNLFFPILFNKYNLRTYITEIAYLKYSFSEIAYC